MGGFLGSHVPVFEIRDAGGPATDMLVRNPALGAALRKTLGDSAVALLRGHGNVVVGGSIREVVFRAVYTEINARWRPKRCGSAGQAMFLNDAEAAAATEQQPGADRPGLGSVEGKGARLGALKLDRAICVDRFVQPETAIFCGRFPLRP